MRIWTLLSEYEREYKEDGIVVVTKNPADDNDFVEVVSNINEI